MDANGIEKERRDREVFRRVFGNEEGKSVLTWILNANGYFSFNPEGIVPERIAFCNVLLNRIGVVHPANLFEDTASRVEKANDLDLNYMADAATSGEAS